MGIVRDRTTNSLGETTAIKSFKGKTIKLIERHASTSILLLFCTDYNDADVSSNTETSSNSNMRPKRINYSSSKNKLNFLY